jgi:hypothetical protein
MFASSIQAEDSGNLAAGGNFSIQVLTKALEARKLYCILCTSQAAVGRCRLNPDPQVDPGLT